MQDEVSPSDSPRLIHEKFEQLNEPDALEKNGWLHLLVEFMEAQQKGLQGAAHYEPIRRHLATDPEAQRIYARLMAVELNDEMESLAANDVTPPKFDLKFLDPPPPTAADNSTE
jgi:hypothetical protein